MADNWFANWQEDIDQLAVELPKRHKNLFFSCGETDFTRQILELKNNLEEYDQFMIAVNIAKIIASFKDAHTALMMPSMRFIPFIFYWFEEGIYVVDATQGYEDFLHRKVTHINEIAIEEIIQKITEIIPHENPSFLKSQLPKYLSSAEVLYGLEIIDNFDEVELIVEGRNGKTAKVIAATCKSFAFQRSMIGSEIHSTEDIPFTEGVPLTDDISSTASIPLFRQNKDKNFWSHFLESQNTMYLNYNSCKDRINISVKDFCADLLDYIDKNQIQKLIVDLRNNLGGDSSLLDPFIEDLSNNQKMNKRGNIFVIIGRDTFSSALLNAYALKNKTAAIFIGEATGGKPNCYGEVSYLQLKNSELKIRYSTEYYETIKDDGQESFFPDIACKVTFADYIVSRDRCMESVLSFSMA